MRHYCVFEVKQGQQVVWAWCLLTTGPGFDEIDFTAADGVTRVDAPHSWSLGRHLFTALVDVGEAPDA